MRITRVADSHRRVSNSQHSSACASSNGSNRNTPINFRSLSEELKRNLNTYTGVPSGSPITIQTLERVQDNFWTSPEEKQEELCDQLWKICENAVIKRLSEAPPSNNPHKPTFHKKLPVIASTREGLDVALGLKQEGRNLIVENIEVNPGGSSVNVARALNNFGTPFELVGVCGNRIKGELFLKALEKEGITPDNFDRLKMDTRIHLSTAINGKEYWLVSCSPVLDDKELGNFTDRLLEACKRQEKETLALANSEPRGASKSYMPEIIRETQDKFGMFTIYDTKMHGVPKEIVEAILKESPSLIKPNLAEFGELVDMDESALRNDRDAIVHFAKEIITKYGINMILVSMDKDGAILIDKNRAAYANAPEIKVASPGCAGDTGIGAIIDRAKKRDFSLRKLTDNRFKSVLSAFIAGGVATASKPGSTLGSLEDAQKLEKDIKVRFI